MCWYNWNPKSGLFPFCLWKKDFAKLSQVQLSTTRGVTFAPYGGEMNCGEFMLWLLPQADAWLLLPISTLTSWGWARAHPRLRQLAWTFDLIRVKLKNLIWSKNIFSKKILRIYFVEDLMANWWIAKILVLFFFLRPTFTFEPTFPFKLFQSDLKPLRYLRLAIVTYS